MSKIRKLLNLLVKHKYITTLVFFAIIIGYADPNSLYDRYQLWLKERYLQEEIDAYAAQYDRDTKLYNELQSDPDAAVRIARERYYMQKDDEDVYLFEDQMTNDHETTE